MKEEKRSVGRPKLADTLLKKKSLIMVGICLVVVLTLLFVGAYKLNIIKFGKLKGDVSCSLEDIPTDLRPGGLNTYGFDDATFYSYLVSKVTSSYNPSCTVTPEQLATIEYVELYDINSDHDISVNGIQYLTGLIRFDLDNNNLNSIDLSNNTALNILNLNYDGLTSIDLSNNTALTTVVLAGNNLSSIDLSNNTALTSVTLAGNNLSSIDLSNNTALTSVTLDGNNLSSIDLSNKTELTSIHLQDNNLSSINLNNSTALMYLYLNGNDLSNIDLSTNTALRHLEIFDSNLSSIDLSHNTSLDYIDIANNNLSSIDLSNNRELYSVFLDHNNLSGTIDLSHLSNLRSEYVSLNHNKLDNVIYPEHIGFVFINSNNIKSMDLRNLQNIQIVSFDNNPIGKTIYALKGEKTKYDSPIMFSSNYQITYTMGDENVATYGNGFINGVNEGITNVQLSSENIIAAHPLFADLMLCTDRCSDETVQKILDEYGITMEELQEIGENPALPYFLLQEVKVYDIASSEYVIDKANKEIDAEGKEIDPTKIDLGLDGLTGEIDGDNFIIKDGDEVADTYTIKNAPKKEETPSENTKPDTKPDTNKTTKPSSKTTTKASGKKLGGTVKKSGTSVKTTTKALTDTQKKILSKIIPTTTNKAVVKEDSKHFNWWWLLLLLLIPVGYAIYKVSKKKN